MFKTHTRYKYLLRWTIKSEVGYAEATHLTLTEEGVMNFKWDLKKLIKEKKEEVSKNAQLRKRSMDSIARPKATKNITSNDPRLQGI